MAANFKREKGAYGEIRAMPRPTQEELDAFYNGVYYSEGVTTTYSAEYDESELAQKQLRADMTVEALVQNLPTLSAGTTFLEVGAGEGFVLNAASKRGLSIQGVDYQIAPIKKFNPAVVDRFHATDPNAFLRDCIASQKQFEGIVLQNVLEHVIDPEGLLAGLRQVLSKDGILLVQIPNDFSALQSLAMERGRIEQETWFAPPQHLTYWNSDNIEAYMDAQGYSIIDGFADFPIETFLWGAPTNYTKDRSFGPFAHRGRVELDLFFSRKGLDKYLNVYRSFYQIGFGRNIVVVLRKA